MSITFVEERPDSADALQLIAELDAHLNSLPYPQESRHAFSVDKLENAIGEFASLPPPR